MAEFTPQSCFQSTSLSPLYPAFLWPTHQRWWSRWVIENNWDLNHSHVYVNSQELYLAFNEERRGFVDGSSTYNTMSPSRSLCPWYQIALILFDTRWCHCERIWCCWTLFDHYKNYTVGHLFTIELKLRYCMKLCLKTYNRGNDYSTDVYWKPDVFVSLSLHYATHGIYKRKRWYSLCFLI